MNLADQLEKLQTLHAQGGLTEEEFTLAKKRVLDGTGEASRPSAAVPSPSPSALHQLRRSTQDKWIGGVCGGLGAMTNIPSWSWRILFVLAALVHGIGVLVYILLWIFVPLQVEAPAAQTPPVMADNK